STCPPGRSVRSRPSNPASFAAAQVCAIDRSARLSVNRTNRIRVVSGRPDALSTRRERLWPERPAGLLRELTDGDFRQLERQVRGKLILPVAQVVGDSLQILGQRPLGNELCVTNVPAHHPLIAETGLVIDKVHCGRSFRTRDQHPTPESPTPHGA